jgi:antitoxin (DNA-binding transcriptional repressor) of toxin-antitoxin stability system
MIKALTASEARSQLGHLLDRAANGKPVCLRRGDRLVRLSPDATLARGKAKQSALRPFGYFKFDDALTALGNRAEPSFTPLDEN